MIHRAPAATAHGVCLLLCAICAAQDAPRTIDPREFGLDLPAGVVAPGGERERVTTLDEDEQPVVGRAHARQMDGETRHKWLAELSRQRSKTLDAPSWLWSSVVELLGTHEAAYLHHCRRFALEPAEERRPAAV